MKDFFKKIRDYAYYLIIMIVSLLATCFLPMIGSEVNVKYTPPSTAQEWLIFLSARILIGLINCMIFFCFTKQAEVNVKDDPNYIRANEILNRVKHEKVKIPESPKQFMKKEWSTKATSITISSILASFTLAGIVLRFDLTQLLVYLFVVILGVFFGYFTMRKHEHYWTDEYLKYALMVEKEKKEMEEQLNGLHDRGQDL